MRLTRPEPVTLATIAAGALALGASIFAYKRFFGSSKSDDQTSNQNDSSATPKPEGSSAKPDAKPATGFLAAFRRSTAEKDSNESDSSGLEEDLTVDTDLANREAKERTPSPS